MSRFLISLQLSEKTLVLSQMFNSPCLGGLNAPIYLCKNRLQQSHSIHHLPSLHVTQHLHFPPGSPTRTSEHLPSCLMLGASAPILSLVPFLAQAISLPDNKITEDQG